MRLEKFLILSLILLGGCSSPDPITTFDAKWEFIDSPVDGKPKACMDEDDADKLKELLLRARIKE